MSSKRAIRRKACDGKIRYTTHVLAAKGLNATHQIKGYVGYMRVYKCQFCHQYHVGHPKHKFQV